MNTSQEGKFILFDNKNSFLGLILYRVRQEKYPLLTGHDEWYTTAIFKIYDLTLSQSR